MAYDLPSDWDHFYLLNLADVHKGNIYLDKRLLLQYVDWVGGAENRLMTLGGDLLEAALKNSKGDVYDATMSPDKARKYMRQILEPVKNSIVGAVEGNHEYRIRKDTSIDCVEILSESLGVPYEREGMVFKFRLGKGRNGKKIAYSTYLTHGFGGGRTVAGKLKNLLSLSDIIFADSYLMGHVHVPLPGSKVYHVPDMQNNVVRKVPQVFASSGAYLDYGGYAQKGGYAPNLMGSSALEFDGKNKYVRALTRGIHELKLDTKRGA